MAWGASPECEAPRSLALEHGAVGGAYHAVAEYGVTFKDIAGAIGRGLDVPMVSMSPEAAVAHFGWFARFAAMDAPASSRRTRALLGWSPIGPGLIEDMEHVGYFQA